MADLNLNNDASTNDNGQRKLFPNKKANIALIVAGVIIVVGIVAAAIWAYTPI